MNTQVHASVSEKLAKSLEADLEGNEDSRQMILQLLGPLFINRYMRDLPHKPDDSVSSYLLIIIIIILHL